MEKSPMGGEDATAPSERSGSFATDAAMLTCPSSVSQVAACVFSAICPQ